MRKRIFVILGVLLVLLGLSQLYIFTGGTKKITENSNAIIILGCKVNGKEPSRFLLERTLKAKELYSEGLGEYIILSGGQGSGEEISEAMCMKKILVDNGIPEDKLLLEDKSKNTYENLRNSKEIVKEKNFNNVIVVSNEFHLRRAKMIGDKLNINAKYSGVFVKDEWLTEIYGGIREIPAIIKDSFR
ncbi:YdcF family protein [Clostridium sp. YIM B02551]|uniref:YdcF family protein n=1 Tax=Clostridium sp. YIM B02551 TaxID=2910679 RepID=UPI001EE9EC00|nr:YdcF family protein [Clostridium sp. YIM B02551]